MFDNIYYFILMIGSGSKESRFPIVNATFF